MSDDLEVVQHLIGASRLFHGKGQPAEKTGLSDQWNKQIQVTPRQVVIQRPRWSGFKVMQGDRKEALLDQSNYLGRDCRLCPAVDGWLCVDLVESIFFYHSEKHLAALCTKIPKELSRGCHQNRLRTLRSTGGARQRVIEGTGDTPRRRPPRALAGGTLTSFLCPEQVLHRL